MHVKTYIRLKHLHFTAAPIEVTKMVTLTDLGFCPNYIAETILSTYNQNGYPNAAPIGATQNSTNQLILKIFNSSSTQKNLSTNRCAVVNLTSNIKLFYQTAFKQTRLPQAWFQKAQTIDAPQLCQADATIEITITDTTPLDSNRTQFTCQPNQITAKQTFPKAHCRAFAATLEAIIHATRIQAFQNNPQQQPKIAQLMAQINACQDIVQHTANNSCYTEILTDLTQRINTWRPTP